MSNLLFFVVLGIFRMTPCASSTRWSLLAQLMLASPAKVRLLFFTGTWLSCGSPPKRSVSVPCTEQATHPQTWACGRTQCHVQVDRVAVLPLQQLKQAVYGKGRRVAGK